jgi:hypothetical protein
VERKLRRLELPHSGQITTLRASPRRPDKS